MVRWIFRQFVVARKSDAEIARQLNRVRIDNHIGRPWTDGMIHTILKNENYLGNIVYNRTSRRLGQKLVKNPEDLWIRSRAAIAPIVDQSMFVRAQKIMADRHVEIPEDQMLRRLRVTLARKGKLNSSVIYNTAGLPSAASYVKHFGSLRKAYALIGYKPSRNCAWIDDRTFWSDVLARLATQVTEALHMGHQVHAELNSVDLVVNGERKISFLTARHMKRRSANHRAQWRVCRRQNLSGMLVVLRLDDANQAIDDYLLLPAKRRAPLHLNFSDKSLAKHSAVCCKDMHELLREIKTRLGGADSSRRRRTE